MFPKQILIESVASDADSGQRCRGIVTTAKVEKGSIAMATDAAPREFSAVTQELGDKIVALTLKEAKELSDYLEEVHGIKPAAGGR